MDALTEDFARSDVETEMTVLQPEDLTETNLEDSDEVENLQNSLREAVHDDNVRPKMQCLMMDSSFSMVTMQGEDSGIAWETTPGQCTRQWVSEAGMPTMDLSSSVPVQPSTAGFQQAGKIIFVMDEELISRQKKTKERVSSTKSKADQQEDVLGERSENIISGRPELMGVSQPNVKNNGEGDEEEAADHMEDKEQRLFSLVSEGFEILNIVVPPKLSTVDEDESKELVDNLSYLEDTSVPKASDDTMDNELLISTNAPVVSGASRSDLLNPSSLINPHIMDPPGAPVPRPPGRGTAGNVDYFEAFTLIDAQAPGGPTVTKQGQVETEVGNVTESVDTETPVEPKDKTTTIKTTVDHEKSDAISLEEITSELLDEVFYGGTEDYLMPSPVRDNEGRAPSRLPSKPSGSTLFGSQEDILTPIFLPEGPPKIIDPVLLEEPKAMAFLYTDLYEEAIGSRKKEEDTESITSETSFHSRHSDREARGYLEKYVLKDETPALEVEQSDKEKHTEEGHWVLTQDLYDFGDFNAKPEKGAETNSEEEVTDFFRDSANSSPCDVDPFPRLVEKEKTQSTTKSKSKTNKSVSITTEKVTEIQVDPLSISSFEFPSEEPDWDITDDDPLLLDENVFGVDTNQDLWKQDLEVQKPVAPPRRKATSSPKTCLDLTPLTPVDALMQEKEEAGGKELREEEKETASPAETADEGGDGEEIGQRSAEVSLCENEFAAGETGSLRTESVKDSDDTNGKHIKPAAAEEKGTETVEEERISETASKQTKPEEAYFKSSESKTNPNKQGDTTALPSEAAKDKGQCVIL
ncbi:Cardiomyopathy-associated protein 5 [Channa argus]|uniref:Cardiomyopathy-associated protein 5 n=1 Tax=Channa argus TaxID=215402 RepID=A0A6G1QGV4_CHAAH|nr:Cardiomyopathy-associated protein 5 [Channa argus]